MNKSDRDENRRYAFDKFISTVICESIVNTKSLEEQTTVNTNSLDEQTTVNTNSLDEQTIVDTNSLDEQMEDNDFCL